MIFFFYSAFVLITFPLDIVSGKGKFCLGRSWELERERVEETVQTPLKTFACLSILSYVFAMIAFFLLFFLLKYLAVNITHELTGLRNGEGAGPSLRSMKRPEA